MNLFNVTQYQTKSIHVYRRLLRESTYLPDHIIRHQIKRQIIFRFRNTLKSRLKLLEKVSQNDSGSEDCIQTLEKRLKNAYRNLNTLQRANQGGQTSFTKVLLYAYGRAGKRRHELLQPFIPGFELRQKLQGSSIHLPVAPFFDSPTLSLDERFLKFPWSNKYGRLRTLVASQISVYYRSQISHIMRSRRQVLKSSQLIIPRLNTWKRPMPQKRIKNMINRWMTKVKYAVLPPLPQEEWYHIHDIAFGKKTLSIIPRRKKIEKDDHITAYDLDNFLFGNKLEQPKILRPVSSKYAKSLDKDHVSNMILESEFGISSNVPIKKNGKDAPHILRNQFIRGLYRKLFSHCNVEKVIDNKQQIIWGSTLWNQQPVIPQLSSLHNLVTTGSINSVKEHS